MQVIQLVQAVPTGAIQIPGRYLDNYHHLSLLAGDLARSA